MAWQFPFTWDGCSVWIIGGGPSIYQQFKIPQEVINEVISLKRPFSEIADYLGPIKEKYVIGVNNAYKLGNWVDIVFFGDGKFYVENRHGLAKYSGIKISRLDRFTNDPSLGVKQIPAHPTKRWGISDKPQFIAWNNNSGAAAISLAAHLKCKRIFLLGFDMCSDGENTHWHGYHHFRFKKPEHAKNRQQPPYDRHMRGFPTIKSDAAALGIEIFNVNPYSRITEFPRITLEDALEMDNESAPHQQTEDDQGSYSDLHTDQGVSD